jgi:ferritin-like metal-binding protein YciE
MQAENLSDLLHRGLEYAWDCERHLLKELPKMELSASCDDLKTVLLGLTHSAGSHTGRLNDIFAKLDRSADAEPHEPIRIITAESEKLARHIDRGPLLDAALIMFGNQICH